MTTKHLVRLCRNGRTQESETIQCGITEENFCTTNTTLNYEDGVMSRIGTPLLEKRYHSARVASCHDSRRDPVRRYAVDGVTSMEVMSGTSRIFQLLPVIRTKFRPSSEIAAKSWCGTSNTLPSAVWTRKGREQCSASRIVSGVTRAVCDRPISCQRTRQPQITGGW